MPTTSDPVPLSRLRRAVATTMEQSAAIPQFTLERRADVGRLQELPAAWEAADARVGLTDLLVAASGRCLRDHPRLNSSWADGGIVEHDAINVGLAVALEDGLVTPAVPNADRAPLPELAAARRRVVDAARDGTLTPEQLFSTTFTISSLGSLGVDRFRALVVPPQAAILAVGAVRAGGLWLSLSVDHRVTDGVPAARFLAALVAMVESPDDLAPGS